MEADGFSKPYDPVKYKPFAIKLLGVQKSVNGWALTNIHNNDNVKSEQSKVEKRESSLPDSSEVTESGRSTKSDEEQV
jgi:hypothetical protein